MNHLDPYSSGTVALQSVQKHEPACQSMITMARTDHGIESNDYGSFVQFDVVQNFSDHHYANSSPGKVCVPFHDLCFCW
jgi:ubiquitin-conjugating enzyme E2 O